MKQSNKFYTSACGPSNGNFLLDIGFEYTKNLEEADVIIFGGGADVEPEFYGEEKSKHTYTSPDREKTEREDFKKGIKLGKKFVGICRGAQLLCSLAGGKLIQDVNGHQGGHSMTTFDGITVQTNSIHHQMINPYAIKNPQDYKILAWSTKRRSNRYLGAKEKSIFLPWDFKEIESVYFPKINALGYQYHPEMMGTSKSYQPAMDWTLKIFEKFFDNEL